MKVPSFTIFALLAVLCVFITLEQQTVVAQTTTGTTSSATSATTATTTSTSSTTTTTTTTQGHTTTTTTAAPTTTTTTPAPFQGYYLKDPAGMFLVVIFGSIAIGLVSTLIFHNVVQPRFAFITSPTDSQLLGVRSSSNNHSSGKNHSFHQQVPSHHQIDSAETAGSRYSGIETGYGTPSEPRY